MSEEDSDSFDFARYNKPAKKRAADPKKKNKDVKKTAKHDANSIKVSNINVVSKDKKRKRSEKSKIEEASTHHEKKRKIFDRDVVFSGKDDDDDASDKHLNVRGDADISHDVQIQDAACMTKNLLPPTDVDSENGMKHIRPLPINDELSMINDSDVSRSVTHRINNYYENVKKIRNMVHEKPFNASRSSSFCDVYHRESATGDTVLNFQQFSTPVSDVIKSIESTILYKTTIQQPIFNKYDMAFIITAANEEYYNLDHVSSNADDMPHIYELLIRSEKWSHPNKNNKKIRIATKPSKQRDKNTKKREVHVNDERKALVDPFDSNEKMMQTPDYVRPLNTVVSLMMQSNDKKTYEAFRSQKRINVEYEKQLSWIKTEKLYQIIKKYAQQAPDRITEVQHCVSVCYLFNTFFKKRKNFETKMSNFVNLLKLKKEIENADEDHFEIDPKELPECLQTIDGDVLSVIFSNFNADAKILKNMKCITNELLFKCWDPFRDNYKEKFGAYQELLKFKKIALESRAETDATEKDETLEKMWSDVYYFELFKKIVSFNKINSWNASDLCTIRSKQDGSKAHLTTITNAFGDLIIQLMNKMSYKTTENDSEYVQVDPDENNPNVEAPKEKVVYDASIVRMLKDTTEMHLKYYRESSKLGPNSIGSKCTRTNSVGPSEKDPKSKTTTNQVQVQVLNAPYVISNDGSSSIGEDSTNRSSYVVFFAIF